ncbi:SDR family oxidoreductase [soil metagenome]
MNKQQRQRTILLTGASGYIGGRLLPALEARDERLRCLARTPSHLESRVSDQTQIVQGDLLDPDSLRGAFEGVDVAYYLVHSMATGDDFEELERQSATNFAGAARKAGVKRIIYLGESGELSPHLESRQRVGEILRQSDVPTIELRASVIIGSGSLSFEMMRALVEKLPLMTAPRWVRSKAQPIAIEDVLSYLVASLDVGIDQSEIVEIGGSEVVSYQDLMLEYARQRNLGRKVIPVPLLSPGLSSLWLGLVTPVYARVGRHLVDSLRHDTIVTSDRARELFSIEPRSAREAIARALANEDREYATTRWSDALSSSGATTSYGGESFGSRIVDSRSVRVRTSTEKAFEPISRIGGSAGWYYGNMLWRLRGFLDLLAGGPGLRRGRRHATEVHPGDTVDFWRVEDFEPGRLLRLRAEMKLPGRAWLQFEVEPVEGGSRIRQTAIFDPVGISGKLYWYALYPIHQIVFRRMLYGVARAVKP